MTQDWKTIVLMALNGSGVSESEALMQIRVIEPMIGEYLKEEREKAYEEMHLAMDRNAVHVRNAVLSEVEKEVRKVSYDNETVNKEYIVYGVNLTKSRLLDAINNLRVE